MRSLCRRRPRASESTACRDASSRDSTPAIVPSRITATRSLSARNSGRSDEIIRTAETLVRELLHEAVNLALGPDVDALGRLVENQHPATVASQRASATFC